MGFEFKLRRVLLVTVQEDYIRDVIGYSVLLGLEKHSHFVC